MKKLHARGFTLIELLIVIALLGALAVGLIGAIDPFEQLKKGTDTGRRDIVNQVQTAIIRYFSVKNATPFAADINPAVTVNDNSFSAALDAIKKSGELRTDFDTIQGANLDYIYVSGTVDPPTVVVCYKPTSKSFQSDPNTKYLNKEGSAVDPAQNGVCKSSSPPGATDCWWCIQ